MAVLFSSLMLEAGCAPAVLIARDRVYCALRAAGLPPAPAWSADPSRLLEEAAGGDTVLFGADTAFGEGNGDFLEEMDRSREDAAGRVLVGALDLRSALAEREARDRPGAGPPAADGRGRGAGAAGAPFAAREPGGSAEAPASVTAPAGPQASEAACGEPRAWAARGEPQASAPASGAARLEAWKRRLLDLSNRNALLSFRSGKRHVDFLVPDLQALASLLEADKKIEIAPAPDPPEGEPALALALAGAPKELADRAARRLAPSGRAQPALTALHFAEDLSLRLRTVFRVARTMLEEGGSNVLFLALGFLEWRDGASRRQAPLALFPAALGRAAGGERHFLQMLDDEPRFNLTLLEKLRREGRALELAPFAAGLPQGKNGTDLGKVMAAAAKAAAAMPGWSVSGRVTLGLFSFSKHLMWKDLEELEEGGKIRESPVLDLLVYGGTGGGLPEAADQPAPLAAAHSAGRARDEGTASAYSAAAEGAKGSPAGAARLLPEDLDSALDPAEECLPLRADSSQLAAVVLAQSGGSFVLIGPPGTGKSQTIANIIAQCLAKGLSVLFVAEKAAALSVVHRRLQAHGLDGFCLELHSNRSDKREVIRRLAAALDEPPAEAPEDWEALSGSVRETRKALNSCARSLHRRYPSGYSLFDAAGAALQREALRVAEPGNDGRAGWALTLTSKGLEDMLGAARELGDLWPHARLAPGLLPFLGGGRWTPGWEKALAATAGAAMGFRERLAPFEGKLRSAGLPDLTDVPLSAAEEAARIACLLPVFSGEDLRFAAGGPQDPERGRLEGALALLLEAAGLLERLPEARKGDDGRLGKIMDALAAEGEGLRARLGAGLEFPDRRRLTLLLRDAAAFGEVYREAWALERSEDGGRAAVSEIGPALEALGAFRAATGRLSPGYDPGRALSLDVRELARRWDEAAGSLAPLRWWRRREIERALKSAGPRSILNAREDLASLAEARRACDALSALGALKGLDRGAGGVFRGRDTDPRDLEALRVLVRRLASGRESLERGLESARAAASALSGILGRAAELEAFIGPRAKKGGWEGRLARGMAKTLLGPLPGDLAEITLERREALGAEAAGAREAVRGFALNAMEMLTVAGWQGRASGATCGEAARAAAEALERRDGLRELAAYAAARARAAGLGLRGLSDALEQGLVAEGQASDAVVRSYASRLLEQALGSGAEELSLTAAQRESLLERFREAYLKKLGLAPARIRGALRAPGRLAALPAAELRLLRREAAKKRRHMPVRKLLASLPVSARMIAPCLLMSPMSIAQYLPADCEPFDLVVFDEASQIPSADAVGALARGRRAVIVGDPRQLPPTDFFMAKAEDGSSWGDGEVSASSWQAGGTGAAGAEEGEAGGAEAMAAESPEAMAAESPEAMAAERPEAMATERPEATAAESPEAPAAESPEAMALESPEEQAADKAEEKAAESLLAKSFGNSGETAEESSGEKAAESLLAKPAASGGKKAAESLLAKSAASGGEKAAESLLTKSAASGGKKPAESLLAKSAASGVEKPAESLLAKSAASDWKKAAESSVWNGTDGVGARGSDGGAGPACGSGAARAPARPVPEDESFAPLESILDECLAAGLPRVVLSWHYRSRSESLISFSNDRYYEGRLVTFPAPCAADMAVSLRLVDSAVYGRGGTRTNPREAEEVAADILALARSPEAGKAGFSVGVVAFSAGQKELIEDMLDDLRGQEPALDALFAEDREEPLIVKNLENIQGDERGVMYFSLGYGPDPAGKMSLNFGPLNKPGGERRLNVAITRARAAVKVFASFAPEAIPDRPGIPRGVADLRDFMRYARERTREAETGSPSQGQASEFAEYVGRGLERRGWAVRRGLGRSGLKLDLGVVDPGDPGRFLAGIECGGAAFRDSLTAADREILRGEVLSGLGWDIRRVWALDWWKPSGDAAAKRLLKELDASLKAQAEERRALAKEK
jgi:hypothetical protein